MSNRNEKVCFVLMPFKKNLEAVYTKAIKPACNKAGFKAIRADKLIGPYNIHRDIIKHIFLSHAVVADLTDRNPNVFYEMGVAHAIDNKTIMIIRKRQKLPFDISSYRCISYDLSESGLKLLKQQIVESLKLINEWRQHPTNPVQEFKPREAFVSKSVLNDLNRELRRNQYTAAAIQRAQGISQHASDAELDAIIPTGMRTIDLARWILAKQKSGKWEALKQKGVTMSTLAQTNGVSVDSLYTQLNRLRKQNAPVPTDMRTTDLVRWVFDKQKKGEWEAFKKKGVTMSTLAQANGVSANSLQVELSKFRKQKRLSQQQSR
ncbi:hypothetical protein L0337_38990 [candidate division KSB1 bacterium]|nr:hypothetical protein [candidate division KSB1 bacterium]